MNVKALLEMQGVRLTHGMSPTDFMNNVVKSPLVNKFVPQLGILSDNIGAVWDGYIKLKNVIQKTKDKLESAEKKLRTLEKALDTYRLIYQGNLQMEGSMAAYQAPGGTSGGPCKPNDSLKAQLVIIQQAQMFVDTQIDSVIPKIKSQIEKLETNLTQYEELMNKQVTKYIDYLISADVFNLPSFTFENETLAQSVDQYTESVTQDEALDVSELEENI